MCIYIFLFLFVYLFWLIRVLHIYIYWKYVERHAVWIHCAVHGWLFHLWVIFWKVGFHWNVDSPAILIAAKSFAYRRLLAQEKEVPWQELFCPRRARDTKSAQLGRQVLYMYPNWWATLKHEITSTGEYSTYEILNQPCLLVMPLLTLLSGDDLHNVGIFPMESAKRWP